jgi:hypothetical protein
MLTIMPHDFVHAFQKHKDHNTKSSKKKKFNRKNLCAKRTNHTDPGPNLELMLS